MSIIESVREYAPTKTALAWTAVGASALTIAVGFMWGGWVTGGTADRMVLEARTGAQAELAAAVCAANFRTSETAQAQFAEIAALSSARQRQFVQDQPWAVVPGLDGVNRTTAELCARMITQMDPDELAAAEAAS